MLSKVMSSSPTWFYRRFWVRLRLIQDLYRTDTSFDPRLWVRLRLIRDLFRTDTHGYKPYSSHTENWYTCSSTPIRREWTDLPSELLKEIASYLGFKDLLCFRSTCKDWRSASFPCFAEIESSVKPWLLVSQDSNSCYKLYNPLEKTTYNMNIPEMEGTLCLGSDRGWLLLSRQNQLFFFCPFTKAKLDLPEFPHSNLANHLAAFTHCPTSPKCIVTVAYYCNDRELELHMIQWGENKWNRIVYKHNNKVYMPLKMASYNEATEVFSYLTVNKDHSDGRIVTFSPKQSSFETIQIGKRSGPSKSTHFVSTSRNYMDQQFSEVLNIKKNVDIIPTCRPIVENNGHSYSFWKSINTTSEESQKAIFIHPIFHNSLLFEAGLFSWF